MKKKHLLTLALWVCLTLSLLTFAGCKKADKPLTVTGVFPAGGAVGVPQDTAVEITFSAEPETLDGFFTISPPVEGAFRYMDNTVSFFPTGGYGERWQYNTAYTVTVGAGLKAKEGKGTLAEDYSFTFTIEDEEWSRYSTVTEWETFLPGDYPVLDLQRHGKGDDSSASGEEYTVTVHRLENGERYLKELCRTIYNSTVHVDTTGLTEVLSFTEKTMGSGWQEDIVFPDTLPEGWYVATALSSSNNSYPIQKLLQIQESAVYTQVDAGQAVLWFNSTATGGPVPGAKLELFGDLFSDEGPVLTARGDENGILILDFPELEEETDSDDSSRKWYSSGRMPYALTDPSGTVYYDILRRNGEKERSLPQDYYGFLYLDRPIYRQDDTVKFWGVARPRKDAPKLDKVEIVLQRGWYDGAVVQQEVSVTADGVFTGEISHKNLKSGYYSLLIYPAGMEREEGEYIQAIGSEDFEVAQYKKPLYTGSITTDKLYYRPGETIETEVSVSLFDRTPANGLDMMVLSDNREKRQYTTDENGLITLPFTAAANSGERDTMWSWRPVSYGIQALGDGPSDVSLDLREYVYVFPTSVMMDAQRTRQGDKCGVTITANYIDFDKIPGGGQLIQDYESLRGEPARAHVTVTLHKVSYTKVDMGATYDRYTKKSVHRYTYHRNETVENSFSQTLGENGTLALPDLAPAPDKDGLERYYVTISTDTGGYQAASLTLGDPWFLEPEDREGHFHTFQVRTQNTPEQPYYSYWGTSFDFGESVRYQVMDNGVPVENGQVLTSYLQGGLLAQPVIRGPQGEIPCTEEKLPNFTLTGAYFDGTRIYPIKPFDMTVNSDSRQMELSILPEQEDYQPGDTARVTLRLMKDGKAVPGASVCLGVVDESVFAVKEQYVQMGWNLYRSVFYDYPDVSASYVQHGVNVYYGDGGKGGGGGDGGVSLREKFQDTAAFLAGTTGADGTAKLTIQLPDNLTEWRLTAVALDRGAFWGQSRSQLYTTLPFRIDPILSSTFLSGDTIACTVRGFGKEVRREDPVEYTASIEGYTEPLEVTALATVGENIPLAFQKLPAGEYSITVTARCGEYSDGVKVPFTVKDSALTFPIHKEIELDPGLGEIEPTHYPVELAVYTPGQKPFMQAWSLLSMDTSGRGDAALAMAAVREAMTAFFGEEYRHPERDLSNVQTPLDDPDGKGYRGIRLFPYAEADLEASAWTAVAAADLIDEDELARYLDNAYTYANNGEEQAAALMGLAALDRLGPDRQLLLKTRAGNKDLSTLESQYLIAGLSYLDEGEAQKLYAAILAPKLLEEKGGLYIKEKTAYETVQSTAGAMACAVLTGAADDAGGMMEYLSKNSATPFGVMRGPCQLQAALYLTRFQWKDSDLPVVSYTMNGTREQVTLPRSGCLRLTLDQAAFEALDLRVETGSAIAGVDYTGMPDQLAEVDSPRITVTKTMDTPEDQKRLGGETTIIIKAELGGELPYGHYRLVEWVPSNMRLREVKRNTRDYFSFRSEEQLLTVDFYYSKDTGRTFTFTYTAASVLDTECTLERTYVYNGQTMECGRTEKGEFLPSDYYYLGVGYLFRKE